MALIPYPVANQYLLLGSQVVDICGRYGVGSTECPEDRLSAWEPIYNSNPERYALLASTIAQLGKLRAPDVVVAPEPGRAFELKSISTALRGWVSEIARAHSKARRTRPIFHF